MEQAESRSRSLHAEAEARSRSLQEAEARSRSLQEAEARSLAVRWGHNSDAAPQVILCTYGRESPHWPNHVNSWSNCEMLGGVAQLF
jgi:hypothetical protein